MLILFDDDLWHITMATGFMVSLSIGEFSGKKVRDAILCHFDINFLLHLSPLTVVVD